MGMYDSFRIKNFKCPFCKKEGEQDFQSKSLDKSLDWYTFPCIIDRKFGCSWEEVKFSPKESKIRKNFNFEFYGSCHYCNEWIAGTGKIKNYIWNEYSVTNKQGKTISKSIPYSKELYDLLDERRKFKTDSNGYKETLSALLMAFYRGELNDEQAILEIDKLLKLDVFKSSQVSSVKGDGGSLDRMFGYKRKIFDILTKKTKSEDVSLGIGEEFDPQGFDE